jgi:hypothetical protein
MSITGAHKALKRLHTPVVVKRKASGSYVNGEWTEGTALADVNTTLGSVPLTPKQVQLLPEGMYTTQDRYFYQAIRPGVSVVAIQKNDRIVLDGVSYIVQDISDRFFDGGFIRYLAKKETL